jgi:hypothetical protein
MTAISIAGVRNALQHVAIVLPAGRSRVLAIQCPQCQMWVSPRRYNTTVLKCRRCYRGPATRSWSRAGRPIPQETPR